MMSHRIHFGRCVMGGLLLVGAPMVQAEPEKTGGVTRRWVRLLPVGDAPPYRQEIRDGVRYQVPPPPGSIPPRKIALMVEEQNLGDTRLVLGGVSKPVAVPSGIRSLPLLSGGEGASSLLWHQVPLPEEGHAMAILWRDPRVGSWEKVRHLVLKDDPQSFSAGQVRLVNVSPFPVAVRLRKEEFKLKPGAFLTKVGGNPEGVELNILVGGRGETWKKVFWSGLVQNPGERVHVVVYRADGERPRRPAKVLVLREWAQLPPLPARGRENEERDAAR